MFSALNRMIRILIRPPVLVSGASALAHYRVPRAEVFYCWQPRYNFPSVGDIIDITAHLEVIARVPEMQMAA